jgi:hypothetical protein
MRQKWTKLYDPTDPRIADSWPRLELRPPPSLGPHPCKDWHLRIVARNGDIGFFGELYQNSRAGALRMGKRWADLLGMGLWERA